MRLWFSHSTEVPLRDQLVRQVSLGILSGELAPGEKLPSVRALATRFHLQRNTVNAAYRQLEEERWVDLRQGSGAYVKASDRISPAVPAASLQRLLDELVDHARHIGISAPDLFARLEATLSEPTPMVLVEADQQLADIVLFEIASAGRLPPELSLLHPAQFPSQLQAQLSNRTPVVLPSKAASAREALGAEAPLLILEITPVATSLAAHLPRSRDHLVAIASHWPRFLELVHTLLISAGFHPDSLILRDARQPDWQAGLTQAASVICDSLTRAALLPGTRPLVFPLLTPAALQHFRLAPPL